MTATHGKLNPRSGGSALGHESHHKQNPDRGKRSGFFLSLRSGSYLNKPPLRSGDDAANKPACVQKTADSHTRGHYSSSGISSILTKFPVVLYPDRHSLAFDVRRFSIMTWFAPLGTPALHAICAPLSIRHPNEPSTSPALKELTTPVVASRIRHIQAAYVKVLAPRVS